MAEVRILVVRLSSLGDVVLTTPVFENIKLARPSARLSVLVKGAFADVFRNNPFIDEVLVFEERGLWGWAGEIRRRKFDVFLDLHDMLRSRFWSLLSGARVVRYDKRSWERRRLVATKSVSPRLSGKVVDRYLESLASLDVPVRTRLPRLYPDADLTPLVLSASADGGPFIGLVPGAAHATKRWPAERFAAAADGLHKQWGGKVLILGSKGDLPAADAAAASLHAPFSNLAGRTSAREMFQLLARCRVVLTNDSGAMHAAAALGVPVTAVFGPTVEPLGFFPSGPHTTVVQVDGLECRPCHLHGLPQCPLGHFKCMTDIPAQRIVDAASKLL